MYEFDLTNVKHSVTKPLFLVGFVHTGLCERMSHICEVICGTPRNSVLNNAHTTAHENYYNLKHVKMYANK